MSATPNARAAAHRARTIAAIARTRATSTGIVLDAENRAFAQWISTLLTDAADALEAEEPAVMDGIVIRNTIDSHARYCLDLADEIAAAHPAVGFPPRLSQYVTVPVFGNGIDLPPSLLPGGPVLIAKEGDLFARLLALHALLETASTTEEVTTAALESAFAFHWKHARLAESEAVAANRPANRPAVPAAVEIATPATPMALRRAHEAHGPTVTYPLSHRRLPCHVSDQGVTHTAVRMVSHLGATITTCDDTTHRDAAAVAARELHDSLG
ncbi:hypothetical protein [Streptomyces ardesiacus]|uniref:hypothetical protein n=1 Tax=Streptomyces ardesiacus TaxID=285564 RepID=UPI000D596D84|nr:hypothetical protein [Streptomyces ardesiacus]